MIFQTFITVVALVLLFVFSIHKFSRQIERVAGERLRSLLKKLTNNPVLGAGVGTVITSILQSSAATLVVSVGLVNAGILTFYGSLGVVFGANIGTTITSQLIALNVIALAPFVVILGFILLKFGGKYSVYGKSVFYFGLVFLCISLISQIVAPLAVNDTIIELFSKVTSLPMTILLGIALTVLFQSSSITSGLILVLAGSGLLSFYQGVGLMLGANIGTTSTVLLAVLPMGIEAKKTAVAHLMFNLLGLIIILPFLKPLSSVVHFIGGNTAVQIANMHLIFNLLSTVIFLIFLQPFIKLIEWIATTRLMHVHVDVNIQSK